MKFIAIFICTVILTFFNASSAFAQTVTVTPNPSPALATNQDSNTVPSGNSILSSFISGFDWISSGLIFYTPSLLDSTIKLQDGTELTGMSTFRTIFYDIAIPLFVLITSFVAFRHISNDNAMQLQQFFKRLILIVGLFIITPAVLSYSIQFTNLLNEKIVSSNTYNLSSFLNSFLESFIQIPMFKGLLGGVLMIPSWDTVLQLIILVISIGFLLIGFIYIVFQAVIRFIALLILSVIFPVVLPFALSEKTENITNTYFRTWFSFLIQQPAFVLGFAIVSAILTSISQAHNNSIGTLFVYSGSLIFLGGINVFIGRIFGEGWSLMTTSAQSMIVARNFNKGAVGITRNENVKRIPAYAGGAIKKTKNMIIKGVNQLKAGNKAGKATIETKRQIEIQRQALIDKGTMANTSVNQGHITSNEVTNTTFTKAKTESETKSATSQHSRDDKRTESVPNQMTANKPSMMIPHKRSPISTRRASATRPIATKRQTPTVTKPQNEISSRKTPRRKITL